MILVKNLATGKSDCDAMEHPFGIMCAVVHNDREDSAIHVGIWGSWSIEDEDDEDHEYAGVSLTRSEFILWLKTTLESMEICL